MSLNECDINKVNYYHYIQAFTTTTLENNCAGKWIATDDAVGLNSGSFSHTAEKSATSSVRFNHTVCDFNSLWLTFLSRISNKNTKQTVQHQVENWQLVR